MDLKTKSGLRNGRMTLGISVVHGYFPRAVATIIPSASSDAVTSVAATPVAHSAKAAVKPKAAATKKGAGKKASSSSTADEQATHPMSTRARDASRAGRLRGEGGSGQKDTCVASSHASKT
jgi:hypothetical protein